jgi:hypothetical protein
MALKSINLESLLKKATEDEKERAHTSKETTKPKLYQEPDMLDWTEKSVAFFFVSFVNKEVSISNNKRN